MPLERARAVSALDASQHSVQRPRNAAWSKRADERTHRRLPSLAAEPAVKLRFRGSSPPRGLLLEGAKRSELAVSVDHLFHRVRAEGADQLVLQVGHADVEAERLHVGSGQAGPEAGSFQSPLEEAFLGGVTETGQLDVEPSRAEALDEAPDRLRTSDRHDREALGGEVPTASLG